MKKNIFQIQASMDTKTIILLALIVETLTLVCYSHIVIAK